MVLEYTRNRLIAHLLANNIYQTGQFRLKSGQTSDFYLDLRVLVSNPSVYGMLVDLLAQLEPDIWNSVDRVCGVPFGGIPLACRIAFSYNLPMIHCRDAPKDCGAGNLVEGVYEKGDRVLLVEDVITTGRSVNEKIAQLESLGLKTAHIVSIIDREDVGVETLRSRGYPVTALVSLSRLRQVRDQLAQPLTGQHLFFDHPFSEEIYRLAYQKQSNLVLSADLEARDILESVDRLGPKIVGLKLHADAISNFGPEFIGALHTRRLLHRFVIIEDRKLADIGYINVRQAQSITEWADAVTVHCTAGADAISAVHRQYPKLGLIPVIEMSSSGSLLGNHSVDQACKMLSGLRSAEIAGVVTQARGLRGLKQHGITVPTFSPGVNLTAAGDTSGQRYTDPRSKSAKLGQFWIVGRGLTGHPELLDEYVSLGWRHFKCGGT